MELAIYTCNDQFGWGCLWLRGRPQTTDTAASEAGQDVWALKEQRQASQLDVM